VGEFLMQRFEYKVIPAPKRGEKAKGAKSTEERFAYALAQVMNSLGQEGWEYVRADTLPCDERVGLTGTKTTFQNMLVFRRAVEVPSVVAPEAELPVPVFSPLRDPAAEAKPTDLAATLGPAHRPAGQTPPLGPAAKHTVAAE